MSSDQTVLVVDDNEPTALALAVRLRNSGYTVMIAKDSRTAAELAREEPPDCLVVDYHLPDGNGLGVIDSVVAATRTPAIPFLMVTGSSKPEHEARAMRMGATGVLRKPYDAQELIRMVDTAIGDAQ